jgi:vacuolar iron transporter family protein
MATPQDIARFRDNLKDEVDGSALYAALAAAEQDPVRKDLFLQLSQAEADHAQFWRDKLTAAGITVEGMVPSFRTRLLARMARRFGPRFVLPTIAAAESAGQNRYAKQADAQALAAEERGHATVLHAATGATAGADAGAMLTATTGADIARAERWHRGASGNDLRAAVLGANDGLVSNFCLIMGVAGAGAANGVILLTGFAGLLAGACSMALGEWLSVTNSRELAESQIAREREELEQTPEAEQKELALIFQAKGLQKEEAQRVAAQIMSNKETALDTLVREELGIDPAEMGGNPWSAAGISFLLFALGAIVSLVPFLFTSGTPAIMLSVGLSALALFVIGIVTSLFNGRNAWFSAGRQVVIGCAAAAVTYGAGALLGVSIA